jgi:hypothetical protein
MDLVDVNAWPGDDISTPVDMDIVPDQIDEIQATETPWSEMIEKA